MSWAALNYVRRLKKETGVVGNIRLVLLMIGWRIPKGHFESRPIPHRALANDTALDVKTVRRCIKRALSLRTPTALLCIGQSGRGRGQFSTYIMPSLAGPLFMVYSGDGKEGELAPISNDEKGGKMPPFSDPEKGGELPSFRSKKGAKRPRSVRTASSRDVRTQKTTTAATEKPAAAALYVSALEYLDWFSATYPTHRGEAQVTVDVEADGPIVVELLTNPTRTVDRLKAMTLAMWTITPEEDPWLARAEDRGLRLLRHTADRLDRIVSMRERTAAAAPRACHYRHDPPCSSMATCLERERQLVAAREAVG